MPAPVIRGVRLPLFTLSAVFFIALLWFFRPVSPPEEEPLPDWGWLSERLLQPVQEERLTLAELRVQAPGALWLQAGVADTRLLYRAQVRKGAVSWRVQAQLQASAEQLQTLREALAIKDAERQLDTAETLRFDAQAVEGLWLSAEPLPPSAAWLASAGEPRLRLQMPPAEAWVYPPQGLTAHVEDGQVTLIQQVPARAMRGNGR